MITRYAPTTRRAFVLALSQLPELPCCAFSHDCLKPLHGDQCPQRKVICYHLSRPHFASLTINLHLPQGRRWAGRSEGCFGKEQGKMNVLEEASNSPHRPLKRARVRQFLRSFARYKYIQYRSAPWRTCSWEAGYNPLICVYLQSSNNYSEPPPLPFLAISPLHSSHLD